MTAKYSTSKKIIVLLVCSGLGNIKRGYESFAEECYDTLKDDATIDIYLLKGAGVSGKKEKVFFNLPRLHPLTKLLSFILKVEAYTIEQFTYFISLIPYLILKKPDVLYLSDFQLGTYLWHLRRLLKLDFKLLFSNGAPNGPPFSRFDYVQQLLPYHAKIAVEGGERMNKHAIVPYGINIHNEPSVDSERRELRMALGLPVDKTIILSVGTVNKSHKRMDYLIQEISQLKDNDMIFTLILGQTHEETEEIKILANKLLGSEKYKIRSVSSKEIGLYYQSADLFVLPSVSEGLPRVSIEACGYGLPVLVHDYPVTREVLGDYGYFADFTQLGSLSKLIKEILSVEENSKDKKARRDYIQSKYSWQVLKSKYVDIIKMCYSS